MTYKTHRWISATAAVNGCILTGASAAMTATIVPVAWATADWPDRLEPDDAREQGVHRRTPTHWLVTGLAVAAAAAMAATLVVPMIAAGVFAGTLIGHLTHVLADGCTIAGVQMLKPFSARNVKLLPKPLRIRVRGVPEKLIVRPLIVVCVIAGIAGWGHTLPTGGGTTPVIAR